MPLIFHNNSFALRIPGRLMFASNLISLSSFVIAALMLRRESKGIIEEMWIHRDPNRCVTFEQFIVQICLRLNREQRIVTFKIFLTCVIWLKLKVCAQFIEFSQLLRLCHRMEFYVCLHSRALFSPDLSYSEASLAGLCRQSDGKTNHDEWDDSHLLSLHNFPSDAIEFIVRKVSPFAWVINRRSRW